VALLWLLVTNLILERRDDVTPECDDYGENEFEVSEDGCAWVGSCRFRLGWLREGDPKVGTRPRTGNTEDGSSLGV
jgi:hypothetical protein